VFDVIGKRNWFFLFSGLILVPGLIFILLTPATNGKVGLKFSVDYTGGTVWQIQFKNPT
jgi:preprotein translocase subunit SecF